MEKSSQEVPEFTGGSLLLLVCQQWWFWASAEILLVLFGFHWLPKPGSSAYNSSACGEAPAVPRRKRRRRRRKRMRAIANYCDKLDQGSSPDLCLQSMDMQKSEEGMKGMVNTSAKPFAQQTLGQSCSQGIQ